jgi:hypothetical protein
MYIGRFLANLCASLPGVAGVAYIYETNDVRGGLLSGMADRIIAGSPAQWVISPRYCVIAITTGL